MVLLILFTMICFIPSLGGVEPSVFFSLWMPGVWSFTLVYQIDRKHTAGRGDAIFACTPSLEWQPLCDWQLPSVWPREPSHLGSASSSATHLWSNYVNPRAAIFPTINRRTGYLMIQTKWSHLWKIHIFWFLFWSYNPLLFFTRNFHAEVQFWVLIQFGGLGTTG